MNSSKSVSTSVLNNPVWHSITQSHSQLGYRSEQAVTYHPQVCPFAGLEEASIEALDDLTRLIPDQGIAAVMTSAQSLPASASWKQLASYHLSQMIHTQHPAAAEHAFIDLTIADAANMIELVKLTEPGPFNARTIEFGGYLGIYEGEQLLAMAGERLHPQGWVEVSGVCTHLSARGQGLAAGLVNEVVVRAKNRGQQAFLNVLQGSPSEHTAIRVYEKLGFQFHQHMAIFALLKL